MFSSRPSQQARSPSPRLLHANFPSATHVFVRTSFFLYYDQLTQLTSLAHGRGGAKVTHPDDLRALVQGLRLTKRLLARMRASGYPVVPHGKFYPFNDGNADDEKKSAAGEAEEEPDVVLADYVRTWGAPCCELSHRFCLFHSSPFTPSAAIHLLILAAPRSHELDVCNSRGRRPWRSL